MITKRGAPFKPAEKRKSQVVQIRLTDGEKAVCEAAASIDDLKMSNWARQTLIKAAAKQLKRR